ncbi:MAG: DNA-3-methyladenine glycosylase II [Parcubacteria bacterium C7867-001]|nr:MAG: DNA-3-methyladenine glycosylase II [Parcubacteria bacterium C7867-001]
MTKRATKPKTKPVHEEAFKHFKKADPILHAAGKKVLPSLLARRDEIRGEIRLFSTLCESVVSQQLSVKAADTIWERLKKACGGRVTPDTVQKTSLLQMRKAGLSAAKAKTLKELAKAMKRELKLTSLRTKTKEEATEILTQVWGIGPWTTEMFLMFALEHPDIFSARDLGLIRAMETLYGIKPNSALHVYEKIAERWSPHRTLASRILWKTRDM